MNSRKLLSLLGYAILLVPVHAHAQIIPSLNGARANTVVANTCVSYANGYTLQNALPDNLALPNGDVLDIATGSNSPSISSFGAVAFYATIPGSSRNNGIFVAQNRVIQTIARGCSTTGCGDAAPGGGTFKTIYSSSSFTPPAINNRGDVLFLASVEGGDSPLGIFLYQASSGQILSVAKQGQLLPNGQIIEELGLATLNNLSQVAFHASYISDFGGLRVLEWSNGTITTKFTEGAGTIEGDEIETMNASRLDLTDGLSAYAPAPAFNDSGTIATLVLLRNNYFGIVRYQPNPIAISVIVRSDDSYSEGGNFFLLEFPILNNRNDIAFYSQLANVTPNRDGWFVVRNGSIVERQQRHQVINGGGIVTNTISSAPHRVLDDCGNLFVGFEVQDEVLALHDVVAVAPAPQTLNVLAYEGETFQHLGLWGEVSTNGLAVFGGWLNGQRGYFVAKPSH